MRRYFYHIIDLNQWHAILLYCSCSCIFFILYLTHHVLRAGVFWYSTSQCQCTHSLLLSRGPKRDRTDDLLNANQALSQLSYGPIPSFGRLIALWWARVDLNHRPHAYQACALTSWATGPSFCESPTSRAGELGGVSKSSRPSVCSVSLCQISNISSRRDTLKTENTIIQLTSIIQLFYLNLTLYLHYYSVCVDFIQWPIDDIAHIKDLLAFSTLQFYFNYFFHLSYVTA